MLSISAIVFHGLRCYHTCFCKQSTSAIVETTRRLFPALTLSKHKGQCGRIGIIGGSQEYTGAPYFAAISALTLGADLAHVICPPEAAPVIKSYSPELIVHPILIPDQPIEEISQWLERFHAVVLGPGLGRREDMAAPIKEIISEIRRLDLPLVIDAISQWLERFHAVVLGPGLGRREDMVAPIKKIISEIRRLNLPLVIDADGLYYVTNDPSLVRNYARAILTPNVVEFARLRDAMTSRDSDDVTQLSTALGHVTIVRKGPEDVISDGHQVVVCETEGSPRRCGGQGDLLCGAMGTFAAWATIPLQSQSRGSFEEWGPWISAAVSACHVTRQCAQQAFKARGRSVTTSDMINCIPDVLKSMNVDT